MKCINTQEKYRDDILQVWNMGKSITNPAFKEIYKRGASVQDTLYKDTILFMGIGASFDDKKHTRALKKQDGCILFETKEVREIYPYYKEIDKLVEETETGFENWSHIDITLLFETRQEKIKPFYRTYPTFMQAQFDLAVKMLKDVAPKVIVVCNAFVRDLFKSPPEQNIKHDVQFTFSEELGTNIITAPVKLKGTPVFFTSMLNGKRALDCGSRERLAWHIRHVCKGDVR